MTAFNLHALLAPPALALLLMSTGPALAAGNAADGHHHGHDAAAASAIGQPGEAARVTRTVRIDMKDTMRYTPARVAVKQGETLRFEVRNSGALTHELVLGTRAELLAHAEMMKKMPEMEHDDPQMVTVKPGERGEIIWHFTQAGSVEFACLQPGHFEAGMKGAVAVKPAPGAKKKPAPATTGATHEHSH